MRSVMTRSFRRLSGIALVLATVAAALVPAAASASPPSRTREAIGSYPRTLARAVALDRAGRVATAWPATHAGFSWRGDEGTGIRYRVHGVSGRVSSWRRAPENHDAERGDRHFSGVLGVGRAATIEWKVVRPPGKRIHDVILDYMNTVDGPRLDSVAKTAPQQQPAGPGAPDIVTRAEWGADESIKSTTGSCTRQFFDVQQLFVHHTVGRNFDTNPEASMRAIYYFHTQRQGWCDVGYNFVVGWDGTIYEGRWAREYGPWEVHSSEDRFGRAVAGAHVSGYNSGSVGISVMGNFSEASPPPAVRRSLAELLAWEADRHGLAPRGSHNYKNPETGTTRRLKYIAGHRDAGYTECPGNYLYDALPAIRRDTEKAMGDGKISTSMAASVTPAKVSYGDSATVYGTLTDEGTSAGYGLQPVTLYAKERRARWAAAATTTTAADGSFSLSVTPGENARLFVVYEGSVDAWGSQTDELGVRVMPDVSLVPQGAYADATGTYHYPEGTSSALLAGSVTPPHPGDRVVVRVWQLALDGSLTLAAKSNRKIDASGTYSYEAALPDSSTGARYRAITWFKGDADHAAGPSPAVYFVIDA